MKVFISWSGDLSGSVAGALREWLPSVIQAVEPWMSELDIEKGARWSADIAAELSDTKAGILCVTKDNVDAPWLNFEAGALSKTIDRTFVCPYVIGLRPSDLTWPIAQFQATEATRTDTRKLIGSLNRALGDNALPEKQLDKAFDIWWPELEKALVDLKSRNVPSRPDRSQKEILEEILGTVRELAQMYSAESRHVHLPAPGARFAVPPFSPSSAADLFSYPKAGADVPLPPWGGPPFPPPFGRTGSKPEPNVS